jgi:hypothetical protein
MKNALVPLKDQLIHHLVTQPESLDMSEFSRVSALCVTTFCLAGLILTVSRVGMRYGPEGRAFGLQEAEIPPNARWVTYEVSLSKKPVNPATVVIPAKARELWAAAYGDAAAKLLPFYARDWELETCHLSQVTPEKLIQLLQVINTVAAEVAVAA